jgi:hypothetical protein
VRAETFQSMARTSSPGAYGRTSLNAMPRPLKTEWYWPPRVSSTARRVAISMRRMRWMRSRVFMAFGRGETGRQGTSTRSRTRDTTFSGVTSSASAS